jgi:hypothetical protein
VVHPNDDRSQHSNSLISRSIRVALEDGVFGPQPRWETQLSGMNTFNPRVNQKWGFQGSETL